MILTNGSEYSHRSVTTRRQTPRVASPVTGSGSDQATGERWIGWFILLATIVLSGTTRSEQFRPPIYDGHDGVTCQYFNAGGRIAWRHRGGDWSDASGRLQGPRPFAQATVPAGGSPTLAFDVTSLVRQWVGSGAENNGLVLVKVRGDRGAAATFHSREAPDMATRPRLIVNLAGEAFPLSFEATADAYLDCTTAYAMGHRPTLRVADGTNSVLRFDLSGLLGSRVKNAQLALTVRDAPSRDIALGVFGLDRPIERSFQQSEVGIASRFPLDRRIQDDPDVFMAADFESPEWRKDWTYIAQHSQVQRVLEDDQGGFVPLSGYALRVEIAKGNQFGLDMAFAFRERLGYEPEEVYLRYYLRFSRTWAPMVDGGKLPGLAATYGKAGWGGRRADPLKGWSMRGLFNRMPPMPNPMNGLTTVGTYAYHADMKEEFGDAWYWTQNGMGSLQRNRWYCLEQHVRLNSPGHRDGTVSAWIDGVSAFEKFDVNFRSTDALKIEMIWMNVFHGGTAATDRDLYLYIDNVVAARQRIGCLKR